MFANLATALDVGGMPYLRNSPKPRFSPRELESTLPLFTENAYIIKNNQNQVQGSVKIIAKPAAPLPQEETVVLVRKGSDAFEAFPDRRSSEDQPKRRVIHDAELNHWHYADDVNKRPFNIELVESENFITLYGEKYELHVDKHQQMQIKVKQVLGEEKLLPVYQDTISARWHLTNPLPLRSTLEQKSILARVSVSRQVLS